MKVIFGNLLPGETPIDDITGLKVCAVATRRQLSLIEAENIRKVLVKYFGGDLSSEIAPFDLTWAKKLHQEMYGDVWDWAGQFRQRDLNLGCSWTQIQERAHNVFEDLSYWKDEGVDLVEQATRLHHQAGFIHPFLNGNGRWARMLTNIWLCLHGSPDVAWPEETIGSDSPIRSGYIEALKAADDGDTDLLLVLHRQYLRAE
jgi:Fic-DOC domain mobile mystery protein B